MYRSSVSDLRCRECSSSRYVGTPAKPAEVSKPALRECADRPSSGIPAAAARVRTIRPTHPDPSRAAVSSPGPRSRRGEHWLRPRHLEAAPHRPPPQRLERPHRASPRLLRMDERMVRHIAPSLRASQHQQHATRRRPHVPPIQPDDLRPSQRPLPAHEQQRPVAHIEVRLVMMRLTRSAVSGSAWCAAAACRSNPRSTAAVFGPAGSTQPRDR